MLHEFKIDNKVIRIYGNKGPVIVLNHYSDDTDKVYEECLNMGCIEFRLVTISNLDWNNEMTPYYAPKVYDAEFLGNADKYIKVLEDSIIPKVKEYVGNCEYYGIVGYSLGGLFAIYCSYKTKLFKRVGSISGSLWYPKFIEYTCNKEIPDIDKVYVSLGNKESKTKNLIMSSVEVRTKELVEYYQSNGINVIYEENEGNHFQNCEKRIAKGIKELLR